jgi:cytochrome c biogenesis protein
MKQKIFRLVADLRFSIFILLLISFCSIIGTIIEQDQSIEIYKINYPLTNPVFGFLTWDRIIQFGLDHVYKTWWFFTLIFLFGLKFNFMYFFTTTSIIKNCTSMSIF